MTEQHPGVWKAPHRTHDDGHFTPLSMQKQPEAAHAATAEGAEQEHQPKRRATVNAYGVAIVVVLLVSAILSTAFLAWALATAWRFVKPVLRAWGL